MYIPESLLNFFLFKCCYDFFQKKSYKEKITFFTFFQVLGARYPPCLPGFFNSRVVLKMGDIQLSENVGLESPPGGGGSRGVFGS